MIIADESLATQCVPATLLNVTWQRVTGLEPVHRPYSLSVTTSS